MKRFAKGIAALGVALAMGAGFAPSASAAHLEADEAAAFCRQMDEQGVLETTGLTRGECINIFKTPGSENGRTVAAGLCGQEFFQEFTGTTNKGQCIKVWSA